MTRFFERVTEPKDKWEKRFFTKGNIYVEIDFENKDFNYVNENELQPGDIILSDNQGQHICSPFYIDKHFKEVL